MATQEVRSKLVEGLRAWGKLEDDLVSASGQILDKTKNPFLELLMDIVRFDAQVHHRVQSFIIESLKGDSKPSSAELADIAVIFSRVRKLATQMLQHSRSSQQAVRGQGLALQQFLLNYLEDDEKTLDKMLGQIEKMVQK